MLNPGDRAFMVTMTPAEIRKEVARALDQKTAVVLPVVGIDGATEIRFNISATSHTAEDNTLDLVTGYTVEENLMVQINIPTTDTPTLVIRADLNP